MWGSRLEHHQTRLLQCDLNSVCHKQFLSRNRITPSPCTIAPNRTPVVLSMMCMGLNKQWDSYPSYEPI
ncbi:hypothetical protein VNO77_27222 [Canavalia gladiata]|uniref:Uncharacterized protein n=1 Tax=Canavalia gladiata TaxID=3824 RepID=A0AAN9Q698_CANGL